MSQILILGWKGVGVGAYWGAHQVIDCDSYKNDPLFVQLPVPSISQGLIHT